MVTSSRIWAFRLIVPGLILLTGIFGLEVAGSLYLRHVLKKALEPKFQFDSYRIYAHRPGFREGDGERDWIVINAQGFRRKNDVPREKRANTVRVFLMGGSAAHGISSAAPYPIVHIQMDETIDYYLEEKLRGEFPDQRIEVINTAVTGYMTYQHTAYIVTELLDYQPDAFIFFDGVNDYYSVNDAVDFYYARNPYQFWKERLQQPTIGGVKDYVAYWLSFHSGLMRGYMAWDMNRDASRQFAEREAGFVEPPTPEALVAAHRRAAPKQFLRSIQANLAILRSYDIDAIVCIQPILSLRREELLSQAERSFLGYERSQLLYETLHPIVVEEVEPVVKEFGMAFVDLNLIFNDRNYRGEQLFIDYVHLTPRGGDLSADGIVPALSKIIRTQLARRSQ